MSLFFNFGWIQVNKKGRKLVILYGSPKNEYTDYDLTMSLQVRLTCKDVILLLNRQHHNRIVESSNQD